MSAFDSRRRMALQLLLGISALAFVAEVIGYFRPGFGEDVAQHWVAPQVVAVGRDPYAPGETARLGAERGLIGAGTGTYHFLERHPYPPFDLFLFKPLSSLSFPVATRLWLVATVGVWLLSIGSLERVVGVPPGSDVSLALRAAMLAWAPALGAMSLGQMDVFLFGLLLLALRLDAGAKARLAGLPLAMASLMKVVPVIWLSHWWVRRRGATLLSAILAAAALTAMSLPVVGVAPHRTFLGSAAGLAAGHQGWTWYVPSNLSWPAWLAKAAAFATGGHDLETFAVAAGRLLGFAVIVAAVATMRRARGQGRDRELAALGVLLFAASMAAGLTWQHHLVGLALPLAVALRRSFDDGDARGFVIAFLVPYLLVGRLDPWFQAWRDLTQGLPKGTRDVLWSLSPAAITAGAVWTAWTAAALARKGRV